MNYETSLIPNSGDLRNAPGVRLSRFVSGRSRRRDRSLPFMGAVGTMSASQGIHNPYTAMDCCYAPALARFFANSIIFTITCIAFSIDCMGIHS